MVEEPGLRKFREQLASRPGGSQTLDELPKFTLQKGPKFCRKVTKSHNRVENCFGNFFTFSCPARKLSKNVAIRLDTF